MVADLCHFVLSCFRGEIRQAKTRKIVTFSCFGMATFRPATRKYNTFHASPFRLLFVVSLPGGAKGRHAKTRKSPFGGFSLGDLSPRQSKIRQTGGETAKGRHVKKPQMVTFLCFCMETFRPPHKSTRYSMRCVFGYCLSYLWLARGKVAMQNPTKFTIRRVFAWRPFAFLPRKHVYTTWHKSATIQLWVSFTQNCVRS